MKIDLFLIVAILFELVKFGVLLFLTYKLVRLTELLNKKLVLLDNGKE